MNWDGLPAGAGVVGVGEAIAGLAAGKRLFAKLASRDESPDIRRDAATGNPARRLELGLVMPGRAPISASSVVRLFARSAAVLDVRAGRTRLRRGRRGSPA